MVSGLEDGGGSVGIYICIYLYICIYFSNIIEGGVRVLTTRDQFHDVQGGGCIGL